MNMRFLVTLGWLALLVWWPLGALGHAQLVSHSPSDGASVDTAPADIRLNFNEPVTPIFIRVFDATGSTISLQDAPKMAQQQTVVQYLPDNLTDGLYVVSWRVISADSHPVGGAFQFTVGNTERGTITTDALLADSAPVQAERLHQANRTLLLLSLLALAGGLWFPLHHTGLTRQPEAQRAVQQWLQWLTYAVMLTSVLQVLLLGWRIGGSQLTLAEWLTAMDIARSTPLGRSSLIAGASALLIFGLNGYIGPPTTMAMAHRLARVVALLMVGSLATTGHTLTHTQAGLAALLLSMHVVLAAYWLGAMPVLWRLSFHGNTRTLAYWLAQFSRHAIWLVGVLILFGVLLASLHLDAPPQLFDSTYGRVLLLKLGLISLALTLALVNQRYITRQLRRNRHDTRLWLRITLAVETVVLVAVIASTAVLSSTMPPNASNGSHDHNHEHGLGGEPVQLIENAGPYRLIFDMEHSHPGLNQWVASFTYNGDVHAPLAVEVAMSLPELELEPRWEEFTKLGQLYVLETDSLALPGKWALQVEALISDFDKITFHLTVPITPR
ncbi:copper resistance protein CopC/CopD [Salinispirillum sp. LH 10-3-1]|uniref:Copper resistance protein C n=1 Tax=Salinispirillum sp. LH 10-3-1 TaxID=2952525 RepID=A0AB38YG21_9GAMM